MQNPSGTITYSRNGQMIPDKNGFITDAEGNMLMGYSANAQGVLQTVDVVPIQIPNSNLSPVATTIITAGLNLGAQQDVPKNTPFDANDGQSFNFHTTVPSVDSLGAKTMVDMYFVKSATTGQWEMWAG